MELVVAIIMLLVACCFILKLSFHAWPGILATAFIAAVFTAMLWEEAAGQSKTQIAAWLERPDLMLDTSVLLTADVLAQVAFCVLMARRLAGAPMTTAQKVLSCLLLWLPGLLIFPVFFSMLVELVFAFPGVDFLMLALYAAIAVFAVMPLLAWGVRLLVPEADMRLELLFLINVLVAALGVVATVNGRTAVKAAGPVEWGALAAVAAMSALFSIAGIFIYKRVQVKLISKIK